MGVVAQRRFRQPFDERLTVVSHALLYGDEKVALLFEAILEVLVTDDLHGLRQHATPVCRSVPDDCGWRKLDSWQWIRRRSSDRGDAWIVM
jgi:hypothetical protein